MTADGWVWVSLGLLLALLGARAWVVETGHATLGRTPVKVTVLTGACGLAVALVVGLVTVNGGARLVYLVLHPAEAQALEDAANAEDLTTAPDVPPTTAVPPEPATVAPPAPAPTTRPGDDPGARDPCAGRAGPGHPGPGDPGPGHACAGHACAGDPGARHRRPRAGDGRAGRAGRAGGAGRGLGDLSVSLSGPARRTWSPGTRRCRRTRPRGRARTA